MRKYDLDRIRWITVALVMVYHIIYMYNGIITDGVVGAAQPRLFPDSLQYLLYPWFMVLLFMVAGICARFDLAQRTPKAFLKRRTRKLLVPSTLGLFVLGWVQGYVNMALSGASSSLPAQIPPPILYLIMVVSGTGVLWFIQMLWVFSLVLLLLRQVGGDRLLAHTAQLSLPAVLAFGLLFYLSGLVLNTPVVVVYRFGIYGFSFLFGYYILSQDAVMDHLARFALPLDGIALVLGLLYLHLHFGDNYAVAPTVNSPSASAYAWFASLGILGSMRRWGNQDGPVSRFMTSRSFGLYVLHYLPLSAMAYLLTFTALPQGVKYLLVSLACFLGAWLLYELISRIPILRWCILGIRKEGKDYVS